MTDLAITTFETLKSVYALAGCQKEGFLHSLLELMQVDYRCLSTAPCSVERQPSQCPCQ
ncbi:MAG: transposase [Cyanobacteria bacterium P01_D01_bin.73]